MMRIEGPFFKDEHGRTLILRGVNLGGSSKVPHRPNGATHLADSLLDHRNVSFVGRPFLLDEADEHFARLHHWGFDLLRFVITWEAIEHAGPGLYDENYLDYLAQVVQKAGEHGLRLFIDPHQDVWSRLSGGDGAPGWTLEAIGLDPMKFSETGAAIVHATHGDPFPHLIWPTNYNKLAVATMFTLFFGGNDFAPRSLVDGEPVQEFLQRCYFAALRQVVHSLKGMAHVVGYGTWNEPSPGFIAWPDLRLHHGQPRLGETPTPFQAMLLADGIPQEVEVWEITLLGPRMHQRRLINTRGARAWLPDRDCIWRQNGIWDTAPDGTPKLLRPDHFAQLSGHRVDFGDYLQPFLLRSVREIRAIDEDAIVFLEGPPRQGRPRWAADDPPDVVHAPHWYDGLTLFTRAFRPYLAVDFHTGKLALTPWGSWRSFRRQLAWIKAKPASHVRDIPTLIGEFGTPFDIEDKQAYHSGDFSPQMRAMDASFRALEANLLSCTLWNYTADNDNERGDQWNGEDLSIFSRDQQTDAANPHSGGRALQSIVRPYARAVAGEPLLMSFDSRRHLFEFRFRHDPLVQAPTEIFVPDYHYQNGCTVEVSDGSFAIEMRSQTLFYRHGSDMDVHSICIRPS